MNMLNTFSLEGGGRAMSKEPPTLANPVWADMAFWEAATAQMIAGEEEKQAPMLAAMDGADAEAMRQNLRFGTVSNVARQMLDFGVDKKIVRQWVLDCSKRKLITDNTHLDQLVKMVSELQTAKKRKYRTSPDAPTQPETWAERAAALAPDSPSFRQQMRDKEAVIEGFGKKIETALKMVKSLAEVLTTSCHGLNDVCDFVEADLQEETAGSNFPFVDVLRGQQRSFAELAQALQDTALSMQAYHTEEVVSLRSKKKGFEAASATLDSSTVKVLSLKNPPAAALAVAQSQLLQQHDDFEMQRFDMDSTVAEVEANRGNFWQQHLAAFVRVQKAFHSKALEALGQNSDALAGVEAKIAESAERRLKLLAEREERRQLLLQSTLSHKHQQTETVCEGWLEQEKKGKLSKGWERRFFVLKSNAVLSHYETEEAKDTLGATLGEIDFNLVARVEDVPHSKLSALRKRSDDSASRSLQFVFNSRIHLLKAETQDARDM